MLEKRVERWERLDLYNFDGVEEWEGVRAEVTVCCREGREEEAGVAVVGVGN